MQLLGQLGSRRSSSNSRFERNLKLNIRKKITWLHVILASTEAKKIALYWLKRCLNYVLSAATAAASAIIYTKRNLWMRSDF